MASARDLLQAYQFLTQRVVSALVTRESDPEQPPFRRPAMAAFGSLAITVITLAAVGVYGVIVPGGNKSWQDGRSVIVAKETGTRYVYVDGRLHPVDNYASALLALDSHAETRSVSRNSLTDVPRGPRIGIAHAPDALPDADRVLRGGWTMCSQQGRDNTGAATPRSRLTVGAAPDGGTPLADSAVLADVPETGDTYLIWRGHRHPVRDQDTVRIALSVGAQSRVEVDLSLIDVLPVGDPLGPIEVREAGAVSRAVPARDDVRAGQVLRAKNSDGSVQHYFAGVERLRPISALQFDIQLAHEPTARAYGEAEPIGVPIGLAAVADASVEPAASPTAGSAPQQRPPFADTEQGAATLCATFDNDEREPRMRIGAPLPEADTAETTEQQTERGTPLADVVSVRPGWAALVEAMPSAQAPRGTIVLVTDQGRAYPLADRKTAELLGYAEVRPVRLPSGVVSRVPQGPGLNPEAVLG